MTSPITNAVIKAGLIHPDYLKEFQRWGAPIEVPEILPETPKDMESAARAIEEALQSEGQVLTRETDLEVLHQYLNTQTQGVLHVEIDAADDMVNSADIPVSFGVTPNLEYIIPYRSESITEEMTNGLTYLRRYDDTSGPKIFFSSVRELFFGETKAFLLCTPSNTVGMPALLTKGGEDGSDIP